MQRMGCMLGCVVVGRKTMELNTTIYKKKLRKWYRQGMTNSENINFGIVQWKWGKGLNCNQSCLGEKPCHFSTP